MVTTSMMKIRQNFHIFLPSNQVNTLIPKNNYQKFHQLKKNCTNDYTWKQINLILPQFHNINTGINNLEVLNFMLFWILWWNLKLFPPSPSWDMRESSLCPASASCRRPQPISHLVAILYIRLIRVVLQCLFSRNPYFTY